MLTQGSPHCMAVAARALLRPLNLLNPSFSTQVDRAMLQGLPAASSDHTVTWRYWCVTDCPKLGSGSLSLRLVSVDMCGAAGTYTDCRSWFCYSPLVPSWHGSSSAYSPGLQLVPSTSEAFHFQKETAVDDAPVALENVNAVPNKEREIVNFENWSVWLLLYTQKLEWFHSIAYLNDH